MFKSTVEGVAFMPPQPCTPLPAPFPANAAFRWLRTDGGGRRIPTVHIRGSSGGGDVVDDDDDGVVVDGGAAGAAGAAGAGAAAAGAAAAGAADADDADAKKKKTRRSAGSRQTILFSHGNAEDLGSLVERFQAVAAHTGADVLLYDYVGYSWEIEAPAGHTQDDADEVPADAEYQPPSEKAAFQSARAAYKYLREGLGVDAEDVVLMGHSLGSGPTTELASTMPASGVVLMSPLRSAISVVTTSLPTTFGSDIMVNEKKVHKIADAVPLFIIHGEDDTVIDVSHGRQLQHLAKKAGHTDVDAWFVAGHGHNDLEFHPQFFERLGAFVAKLRSLPPRSEEELTPHSRKRAGMFSSSSVSSSSLS